MTPLPPTFTEETKREFGSILMHHATDAIQGKITTDENIEKLLSRTQEAYDLGRAETLKEVRELCEGMKIENPKCYCKTHPEHNCGVTSNEALSDLITRLTQ